MDSSKTVNYLQKVVLCVDDPSGPVVGTFHHPFLHVGRMMGLIPFLQHAQSATIIVNIIYNNVTLKCIEELQ